MNIKQSFYLILILLRKPQNFNRIVFNIANAKLHHLFPINWAGRRYATCTSPVSHQVHTSENDLEILVTVRLVTIKYYKLGIWYSLFGRVVELVLVGAAEAFLDS